jgi:hypothetical protein
VIACALKSKAKMAKACLVRLIKQLLRRTLNKLPERESPLEFQAGFFVGDC